MQLKDCSETTVLFSTPALKELGKGRSWFIFLIVKTRCAHTDRMFFGSLRSPSNIMSSTHESSLLSTSVSILNGSNYLVWKNQMRAWLRSKGPGRSQMVMRRSSTNSILAHHLLLMKLITSNTWIGTTKMIKPMARSFSG